MPGALRVWLCSKELSAPISHGLGHGRRNDIGLILRWAEGCPDHARGGCLQAVRREGRQETEGEKCKQKARWKTTARHETWLHRKTRGQRSIGRAWLASVELGLGMPGWKGSEL